MDQSSQRHLRILTEIAERQDVTQRGLSKSLGIALGLTNLYLKRLARKGYIKVTTIPPNRLKYLVTPKGFAEKSRLTYEYMCMSLALYQKARQTLREALQPAIQGGLKRVALYGVGEAAELAYLTLREVGLEPVAVFADAEPAPFLGLPVRPIEELVEIDVDRVILATFEPTVEHHLAKLRRWVPDEKVIVLHRARGEPSAPVGERRG